MNIIYMHSHDTGRYIAPYGYGIPTPRLMKLAEEGTLFRQAYCAAPTCSASRSALMTGMTPHSNGMLGLAHRGFRLHDYSRHLVQYLNRFAYDTVLSGVQHEAADASLLGYKHLLHEGERSGETSADRDLANARKAAAYIREFAKAGQGRRLFLSYGMNNTHREFPATHEVNPNYVMPPYPMYDCAGNRQDAAAYAASAAVMDACAGIVLDALRDAGLDGDTLVLYTTDHGIAFPLMKSTLYDSGIGVSLIVRSPGNRAAGQALDALVSQLDIFPTICDFAGIPKPDWLQGYSLMPLLRGQTDHVRREIFAEMNFHAAREPMRCIRTDRYKLIRRYEQAERVRPSNIDDGRSKSFMIDAGLLQETHAPEMLFDLHLDPVERINRIDQPAYAEVKGQLSARMAEWMAQTSDPLLRGKLIAPAGARVNAPATLSPRDRDCEL